MSNVTRQFNLDLNVYQLPNPNQIVIDADTGERLQFYRANSLEFSITFGDGSGDFDMSSVGKVSLEVKQPSCSISPPRPLAPLQMYKEAEGPFSTGVPVVISFDADETAIGDGVNWMSITLYSASGERMTTVSGTVFVLGNGYGAANVPDVQDLRDQAVQAAVNSCACADRSEAAALDAESEADRAQDIADNLQAVGTALSYRGEWTASTAPTGAQRGYFWVITTAHTWGGIAWQVGDAALYNGSTWSRVALDWLLAQANANIDALRSEVDIRKQPVGGIHTASGGYAVIPTLSINDLSQGGGNSFTLAWAGKAVERNGATGAAYNQLFGNARGLATHPPGSAGISISNVTGVLTGVPAFIFDTSNMRPADFDRLNVDSIFVVTVNFATGIASLYAENEVVVTANISSTTFNNTNPLLCMRNNNYASGMTGYTNAATGWTKALTATEIAEYVGSGGKIVPVSSRAACKVHLVFDEGTGFQIHDRSGNGNHALLTETGCTQLIPKDGATVGGSNVNASSATYLLRSGQVLPSSSIVTGVIVDGEYLPATGAQSSTQTRIRLNPTGGDLEVQRSDGSTHAPIATFTPASLASVDVKVISQSAS